MPSQNSHDKIVVVQLHCVQLFDIPWTVAHQVPLSMEFSRQENWSVLPFPFPWYLSNPGIKPTSSALAGRFFITVPEGKPLWVLVNSNQNTDESKPHRGILQLNCWKLNVKKKNLESGLRKMTHYIHGNKYLRSHYHYK